MHSSCMGRKKCNQGCSESLRESAIQRFDKKSLERPNQPRTLARSHSAIQRFNKKSLGAQNAHAEKSYDFIVFVLISAQILVFL